MATKGEYMTSGHFFCSCCNDVVNIRFTGSLAEQCPVCRNKSATWVEHLPRRNGAAVVDFERGKALFASMRKSI